GVTHASIVRLFFSCSAAPRDLHSFPTRRSSDLRADEVRVGLSAPALGRHEAAGRHRPRAGQPAAHLADGRAVRRAGRPDPLPDADRKSTRLNSSHVAISYAVFCLKKKKIPYLE